MFSLVGKQTNQKGEDLFVLMEPRLTLLAALSNKKPHEIILLSSLVSSTALWPASAGQG